MLVCTTNEGKRKEFKAFFESHGIYVERCRDKGIEIQGSLEEVAMYSAAQLYAKYRRSLIVEDAGLFIRALRRFPGPYSSYVMRTIGYQGILKLMEGVEDRYAEFRSVIAYASNGEIRIFKGVVKGSIAYEARGSSGFGFDPIFIPEGHDRTFAEMSVEEKNEISHRGRALRRLVEYIKRILLRFDHEVLDSL